VNIWIAVALLWLIIIPAIVLSCVGLLALWDRGMEARRLERQWPDEPRVRVLARSKPDKPFDQDAA
jgi:hypothetical protein